MLNTFQVPTGALAGVIVFSTGGKLWIYGFIPSGGIIIALNDDMTIEVNLFIPGVVFQHGASSGDGHSFFIGTTGKKT